MKIDLKNLKLHPRESEEFHLIKQLQPDLLSDSEGKVKGPVSADLLVEYTGRAFIGKGTVTARVQLFCSRCLKELEICLSTDINITMVESKYQQDFAPDDEVIILAGDEVNIEPWVREAILLQLPLQPLCSKDCKGLCPECGADKNIYECQCKLEHIDPRWEKLKDLK